MKRTTIAAILAIVLVAGLFSAPARAELSSAEKGKFGAEVMLWWPTVTGNATFDSKYISGTDLDVIDELDVDKVATTLQFNAYFNLTKRNRFSFAWFIDQRSGTRVLEDSVTIAGKTFGAGVEIDSNLDVQRYKLLYERALIRRDQGRIALGIGVSYIDALAKIEAKAIDESESQRIAFALPVIAGAVDLHLPLGFGAFAEASGMGLTYSYVNGQYFDARGGVNWKSRFVFAQAGYQYFVLKADAFDSLQVEYRLVGPFVSVGVKL